MPNASSNRVQIELGLHSVKQTLSKMQDVHIMYIEQSTYPEDIVTYLTLYAGVHVALQYLYLS